MRTRDARFRKFTVTESGYALITPGGRWEALNGSLPELLAHYVEHRCVDATVSARFDIQNPETFDVVMMHMFRAGFEVHALDRPVTFTVKHQDIVHTMMRTEIRGDDPETGERVLTDAALTCPESSTIAITNPEVTNVPGGHQ